MRKTNLIFNIFTTAFIVIALLVALFANEKTMAQYIIPPLAAAFSTSIIHLFINTDKDNY